jgi:hypothetical protein
LKDGKNMLTDKSDKWFTIVELEVWQIEFIVKNNLNLFYIEVIKMRVRIRERERCRERKHRQFTFMLFI